MPKTLHLTNTLADETRYSIYQYIVKESKEVTVQEIAIQFGIHPNVARLHLSKLNESELLRSELTKNGKGGRPARIYKLAEKPIYLSFPKQEDHLLLQWLMEMATSFGQEAILKGKEIAYQAGKQLMQHSTAPSFSFEDRLNKLTEAATSIGYIPNVLEEGDKKIITFSVYSCPYKEHLKTNPDLICELHKAYLKGQFDTLFATTDFVQLENMRHDCQHCLYRIEVL